MKAARGTLEIERSDVLLRLHPRRGTIEMALSLGEDTEWYPIALTDAERRSLAVSLLERRPVMIAPDRD